MSAAAAGITLLDGGMGRELSRMGAPFRLPEWSALALIEGPQFVSRAHAAFIAAGADIITTNSYGLAPSRLGAERFARDGLRLADLAGRLARMEAGRAGRRVRVAGSLPPIFETYRPELFEPDEAPRILAVVAAGLAPHIDFWLVETQSSMAESAAAIAAVRATGLPIWVSYTLRDEIGREGPPELRSGERVEQAVARDLSLGTAAVLFNCSQAEVMNAAVLAAAPIVARSASPHAPIGVYANAFKPEPQAVEPYAGISEMREDLGPARYLEFARTWVESGATVVGGCCGIGPEYIAALRAHFR